jgi:hypothetical protein
MSAGESDAKSRRRLSDGGVEGERASGSGPAARPSAPSDRRTSEESVPAIPFIADEIAMASLRAAASSPKAGSAELRCDACDAPIEGEPGGHGLYFWSRGEELRLEEPPLCEDCAAAVTATANRRWDSEEEEG